MPILRLCTFNIRYDSKPDGIPLSDTLSTLPPTPPLPLTTAPTKSEAPWSQRRIPLARSLLFHAPAILFIQEALQAQLTELSTLLSLPFVGVGRGDGKSAGEHSAVLYNPDILTLDSSDTIWLSNTPSVPGSTYPGAGCPRTATFARFTVKDSGHRVCVVCTHWDHVSDAQRCLAASMVRYRAAWECEHWGPVWVGGDFNSPSTGPDSAGYQVLMGERGMVKMEEAYVKRYRTSEKTVRGLRNMAECVEDPMHWSGHLATFTGFEGGGEAGGQRLDFLCGVGDGWRVRRWRVGGNDSDAECRASDHRPVYADVEVVEGKKRGY